VLESKAVMMVKHTRFKAIYLGADS